jgi:hypothetical protein
MNTTLHWALCWLRSRFVGARVCLYFFGEHLLTYRDRHEELIHSILETWFYCVLYSEFPVSATLYALPFLIPCTVTTTILYFGRSLFFDAGDFTNSSDRTDTTTSFSFL